MAQALVAADLDLAADVRLNLTTQVTLNLVVAVDVGAELDQLLLGEVLDAGVGVDARRLQGLVRAVS